MKQAAEHNRNPQKIPDAIHSGNTATIEGEKAFDNFIAGLFLAMRGKQQSCLPSPEYCTQRLEAEGIPTYSLDYTAFEWFYNGFNAAIYLMQEDEKETED